VNGIRNLRKSGDDISYALLERGDFHTTEDVIYVLDTNLDLVVSNESWKRYAAENNGEHLLQENARINALNSMSDGHKGRWRALYDELLSGHLREYRENISCPAPNLRRKLELTVRPITSAAGAVEYLEHRTHQVSTGSPLTSKQNEKAMVSEDPKQGSARQPLMLRAFSRPLKGVGGDLVWSHRESESCGWFLIADAMGHDERAAAAAEQLRDIIAENLSGTPSSILEVANKKFLLANAGEDNVMFVTGILFRIDLDVHEARVCVFGHHGFLTSTSGIVEITGGLPVGILMDAPPWPEHVLDTRTLGPRILAFTDGLFEQFNSLGEMYTIERIAAKFLETMNVTLSESIRQIIQSIDEFRNGAGVKDDQSVMGFEFTT
jgi:hypothetical protein